MRLAGSMPADSLCASPGPATGPRWAGGLRAVAAIGRGLSQWYGFLSVFFIAFAVFLWGPVLFGLNLTQIGMDVALLSVAFSSVARLLAEFSSLSAVLITDDLACRSPESRKQESQTGGRRNAPSDPRRA